MQVRTMALDCDQFLSLFDTKIKEMYIGLGLAHAWPSRDLDSPTEGAWCILFMFSKFIFVG
jgi:hypothetical protein